MIWWRAMSQTNILSSQLVPAYIWDILYWILWYIHLKRYGQSLCKLTLFGNWKVSVQEQCLPVKHVLMGGVCVLRVPVSTIYQRVVKVFSLSTHHPRVTSTGKLTDGCTEKSKLNFKFRVQRKLFFWLALQASCNYHLLAQKSFSLNAKNSISYS